MVPVEQVMFTTIYTKSYGEITIVTIVHNTYVLHIGYQGGNTRSLGFITFRRVTASKHRADGTGYRAQGTGYRAQGRVINISIQTLAHNILKSCAW